ncbi:collagen alpha-6(VI) chain-like [Lineus longissimus]|uniref:collagen alpha-6(VI) chain-like n=1 Tax=Lineus longissimus TaxID=88925 RepID=UPI002B4DB063
MNFSNFLQLGTLVLASLVLIAEAGPAKGKSQCYLKRLDLMFVLDTSYSLTPEDFKQLKTFANAIIKGLREQGTKLDVGVVKYGATAVVEVDLDNNLSRPELQKAINDITHDAEFGTNTHLGLNLARLELSEKTTCTCGSPKGIVLLTDGFPSYASSAFLEARVARELGYHIFVVAMGEDSNFQGATVENLAAMFTDGDKRRVDRVMKASELGSFVDVVVKKMCGDYDQKRSTPPVPMTQKYYEKEWPLFS